MYCDWRYESGAVAAPKFSGRDAEWICRRLGIGEGRGDITYLGLLDGESRSVSALSTYIQRGSKSWFRWPHGYTLNESVGTAREIGGILMKSLVKKVQRFLVSEDGPTAVEYAVMLALIIIVCLTGITAIGTRASTAFTTVSNSLPSGS